MLVPMAKGGQRTRPFSKTIALKTRSQTHLAVQSLCFSEGKCHIAGQQVPMGPLDEEKDKAGGGTEKGKTSDYLL